uniref:BFN domain-containing protein n=1 Tax=Kalanchoe fedtschenkoi TaxID=63787 RepID=A0A7N0V1E1_KALFE
MLAVRFTVSGLPNLASSSSSFFPSDPSSAGCRFSTCSHLSMLHMRFRPVRSRRSHLFFVCCQSDGSHQRPDDFIQASILLSGHYRQLKYGFTQNGSGQPAPHKRTPFSLPLKEPQRSIGAIGQGILRRFQNPTVFLKISCDGDFLLPIAVGEHAIDRLTDASWETEDGDHPNQFQFVKNLVLRLGYEVNMVRITKRVGNTYFAKVCLSKPGEATSITVDIRPSDAINVAKRCMAPIYINKQIVATDAIQIAYGMIRTHPTKSVYDVTLDSPADGPDVLVKELGLVNNMKLAVLEERYSDAAIIRDQLIELRKT